MNLEHWIEVLSDEIDSQKAKIKLQVLREVISHCHNPQEGLTIDDMILLFPSIVQLLYVDWKSFLSNGNAIKGGVMLFFYLMLNRMELLMSLGEDPRMKGKLESYQKRILREAFLMYESCHELFAFARSSLIEASQNLLQKRQYASHQNLMSLFSETETESSFFLFYTVSNIFLMYQEELASLMWGELSIFDPNLVESTIDNFLTEIQIFYLSFYHVSNLRNPTKFDPSLSKNSPTSISHFSPPELDHDQSDYYIYYSGLDFPNTRITESLSSPILSSPVLLSPSSSLPSPPLRVFIDDSTKPSPWSLLHPSIDKSLDPNATPSMNSGKHKTDIALVWAGAFGFGLGHKILTSVIKSVERMVEHQKLRFPEKENSAQHLERRLSLQRRLFSLSTVVLNSISENLISAAFLLREMSLLNSSSPLLSSPFLSSSPKKHRAGQAETDSTHSPLATWRYAYLQRMEEEKGGSLLRTGLATDPSWSFYHLTNTVSALQDRLDAPLWEKLEGNIFTLPLLLLPQTSSPASGSSFDELKFEVRLMQHSSISLLTSHFQFLDCELLNVKSSPSIDNVNPRDANKKKDSTKGRDAQKTESSKNVRSRSYGGATPILEQINLFLDVFAISQGERDSETQLVLQQHLLPFLVGDITEREVDKYLPLAGHFFMLSLSKFNSLNIFLDLLSEQTEMLEDERTARTHVLISGNVGSLIFPGWEEGKDVHWVNLEAISSFVKRRTEGESRAKRDIEERNKWVTSVYGWDFVLANQSLFFILSFESFLFRLGVSLSLSHYSHQNLMDYLSIKNLSSDERIRERWENFDIRRRQLLLVRIFCLSCHQLLEREKARLMESNDVSSKRRKTSQTLIQFSCIRLFLSDIIILMTLLTDEMLMSELNLTKGQLTSCTPRIALYIYLVYERVLQIFHCIMETLDYILKARRLQLSLCADEMKFLGFCFLTCDKVIDVLNKIEYFNQKLASIYRSIHEKRRHVSHDSRCILNRILHHPIFSSALLISMPQSPQHGGTASRSSVAAAMVHQKVLLMNSINKSSFLFFDIALLQVDKFFSHQKTDTFTNFVASKYAATLLFTSKSTSLISSKQQKDFYPYFSSSLLSIFKKFILYSTTNNQLAESIHDAIAYVITTIVYANNSIEDPERNGRNGKCILMHWLLALIDIVEKKLITPPLVFKLLPLIGNTLFKKRSNFRDVYNTFHQLFILYFYFAKLILLTTKNLSAIYDGNDYSHLQSDYIKFFDNSNDKSKVINNTHLSLLLPPRHVSPAPPVSNLCIGGHKGDIFSDSETDFNQAKNQESDKNQSNSSSGDSKELWDNNTLMKKYFSSTLLEVLAQANTWLDHVTIKLKSFPKYSQSFSPYAASNYSTSMYSNDSDAFINDTMSSTTVAAMILLQLDVLLMCWVDMYGYLRNESTDKYLTTIVNNKKLMSWVKTLMSIAQNLFQIENIHTLLHQEIEFYGKKCSIIIQLMEKKLLPYENRTNIPSLSSNSYLSSPHPPISSPSSAGGFLSDVHSVQDFNNQCRHQLLGVLCKLFMRYGDEKYIQAFSFVYNLNKTTSSLLLSPLISPSTRHLPSGKKNPENPLSSAPTLSSLRRHTGPSDHTEALEGVLRVVSQKYSIAMSNLRSLYDSNDKVSLLPINTCTSILLFMNSSYDLRVSEEIHREEQAQRLLESSGRENAFSKSLEKNAARGKDIKARSGDQGLLMMKNHLATMTLVQVQTIEDVIHLRVNVTLHEKRIKRILLLFHLRHSNRTAMETSVIPLLLEDFFIENPICERMHQHSLFESSFSYTVRVRYPHQYSLAGGWQGLEEKNFGLLRSSLQQLFESSLYVSVDMTTEADSSAALHQKSAIMEEREYASSVVDCVHPLTIDEDFNFSSQMERHFVFDSIEISFMNFSFWFQECYAFSPRVSCSFLLNSILRPKMDMGNLEKRQKELSSIFPFFSYCQVRLLQPQLLTARSIRAFQKIADNGSGCIHVGYFVSQSAAVMLIHGYIRSPPIEIHSENNEQRPVYVFSNSKVLAATVADNIHDFFSNEQSGQAI